jgi:PhnB protein
MTLETYLFFNGRSDEAIEYYGRILGAQAGSLMRYRESPEPPQPGCLPPGCEDKVMHATLKIGDTTIMLSDGSCTGDPQFQGFSLVLNLPDEDTVRSTYAALAEDGKVIMPPAKTFWSPCFGMLSDRFGLGWMLMVYPQP